VTDLTRGKHQRRLLLSGLGLDDVSSFVAQIAEVAPSPEVTELAAAVHRQTDGNPFFVTELVRRLASQGRLDATPDDPGVLAASRRGGREDAADVGLGEELLRRGHPGVDPRELVHRRLVAMDGAE
jgi:hypothetical protein